MESEQTPVPATALPAGEYRYELRRGGELAAIEVETLAAGFIRGVRRTPDGLNRHQVEARLDAGGFIVAVGVRYNRGPFKRSASYEASGDLIRGHLIAAGGREEVSSKLGRMREVDVGMSNHVVVERLRVLLDQLGPKLGPACALIVTPGVGDQARIFQTEATGFGLRVKLFSDERIARQWLNGLRKRAISGRC